MPKAEFTPALKAVLAHEGGYVNHPRDPGGATNYGVTQRVYDGYRERQDRPLQSVRHIAKVEVSAIYQRQYWNAIRGDELPAGVAYVVFDGAVNSGPGQAARWLQRALRMNAVDGVIGEATLAAARNHPDHDKLIADMLALRMAFLRRLKTWDAFGRGWTSRVNEVRVRGQAWASGSVGPEPAPVEGGNAKARIEDAKPAPSSTVSDLGAAAGTTGATTGAVLQDAQEKLTPLAEYSATIRTVLAVLVIGGALVGIGSLVIGQVQRYRAKKHAEALS